LTSLKLEFAYFSGYARIMQWRERRPALFCGSSGCAVAPRAIQPLRSGEITPRFLDRTIRALKRWKFDIVSMDEVCQRAVTLASRRRLLA